MRHGFCFYEWMRATKWSNGTTTALALCGTFVPVPCDATAPKCADCARTAATHGLLCDCFKHWAKPTIEGDVVPPALR